MDYRGVFKTLAVRKELIDQEVYAVDFEKDKVDEMTLALMWLVFHQDRDGAARAWKSFDWGTMDRLHEKGYISDPEEEGQVCCGKP